MLPAARLLYKQSISNSSMTAQQVLGKHRQAQTSTHSSTLTREPVAQRIVLLCAQVFDERHVLFICMSIVNDQLAAGTLHAEYHF